MHKAARWEDDKGLTRKALTGPLTPIRVSATAWHHEPIINWSLPEHYRNIEQLTDWLSPAAAEWLR